MKFDVNSIKELIGESEITDETILKIKMMVESTISDRVSELQTQLAELKTTHEAEVITLQEAAQKKLDDEVSSIKQQSNEYIQNLVKEMTSKLDAYGDFVVEKFITENKQALVDSEEYSRMKSVFENIRTTFANAQFTIEPTDITAKLETELADLKESYNTLFDANQRLMQEKQDMSYLMAFNEMTASLADTQREELQSLIEKFTFSGIDEFKSGVNILIKQIQEAKKPIESRENDDGKPSESSSRYGRFL